MAKKPFKLKSGNTTPFKQMGSSPVKQDEMMVSDKDKQRGWTLAMMAKETGKHLGKDITMLSKASSKVLGAASVPWMLYDFYKSGKEHSGGKAGSKEGQDKWEATKKKAGKSDVWG